MQAFGERFGHTVHLGIRDGVEVVYIDKVEPRHGVLVGSTIGQRRPIPVTALGKALLAHSAPSLLAEVGATGWARRTPNTLQSLTDLEAQLVAVRENGYALDDEESDLGLRCAAAPIFNHAGLPIAAISVTTLSSRVTSEALRQLGFELGQAAHGITLTLGGTAPTG
jgi:DNA-binding IclR family transcriptional regulator